VLKGKLAYMSPEQVRGGALDARSDVFSLGVVRWECLAGKRLFQRDTDMETLVAVADEEAPRLDTIDPELPGQLVEITARALARDRDRRYQSAAEMHGALAAYMATTGAAAGMPDIAEFMQGLFSGRMATKQRAIDEAAAPGDAVEDFTTVFSDIGDVPAVAEPPAPEPAAPGRSWRRPALLVLLAGALVSAGVLGARLLRQEEPDPPREERPVRAAEPEESVKEPAPENAVEPRPAEIRPRPPRRPGRKAWPKKPGVARDKKADLPASRSGKLRLNTTPWVEIYHRGKRIGQTPLVDVELPAGHVMLRAVNRKDGIDKIIHVNIKPGKTIVRHHSFP
jgi:serine/threonine-protein kinase